MRAYICDRCEKTEKKPEPGNAFDSYEEASISTPNRWEILRLPNPNSHIINMVNTLLCDGCIIQLKLWGKPPVSDG